MFDVVVVGGGPAGCAAARACAGEGLSTLLVEEHAGIGIPVQCAGLLSLEAFRECGVSERSILHRVYGARIVGNGGIEASFADDRPRAYVVDRMVLDREMAEEAAGAGAQVMVKTTAAGISGQTLTVRGPGGSRQIPFRMLIAADGPRSSIARMMGLARSPVHLAGIQAELPCRVADERLVELHPHASEDFFGWMIPSGKGRARVGLCGLSGVRSRFETFVSRFGATSLHLVTGTIPLGVMPRTFAGRTLFAGDAAGFAKPTSGGGIYTGVRSAKHAAGVAVQCCSEGRFAPSDLSRYEERWKADFGRDLALGYRLFSLRRRLVPETIDAAIREIGSDAWVACILAAGDMDRPGKLLREAMRRPACAGLLRAVLGSELRRIAYEKLTPLF
ncbi:MAG: NAD(P)/FAD-dependent oxidoreductase [Methanomicrobiaceae archaeon]|nr:NAD(P)/FAD-dependent oxidoreductase [Methanomicrobiaceae archaeon]